MLCACMIEAMPHILIVFAVCSCVPLFMSLFLFRSFSLRAIYLVYGCLLRNHSMDETILCNAHCSPKKDFFLLVVLFSLSVFLLNFNQFHVWCILSPFHQKIKTDSVFFSEYFVAVFIIVIGSHAVCISIVAHFTQRIIIESNPNTHKHTQSNTRTV